MGQGGGIRGPTDVKPVDNVGTSVFYTSRKSYSDNAIISTSWINTKSQIALADHARYNV